MEITIPIPAFDPALIIACVALGWTIRQELTHILHKRVGNFMTDKLLNEEQKREVRLLNCLSLKGRLLRDKKGITEKLQND